MRAQGLHTVQVFSPSFLELAFQEWVNGVGVADQEPASDIGAYLAAYAAWVSTTLSGQHTAASGTDLLTVVAQHQCRRFPNAGSILCDILIGHTYIVDLVFQ